MVGIKKFSAIAAVSAVAVTGAVASLQPSDAAHAQHLQSHRRHLQNQQRPSLIKIQKRLGFTIGDGLGGIINGLGQDLGLNELDDTQGNLQNLRRGLVGDLVGAGGQGGQPSSSASSAPPASTSRAPSNNNGGGSSSNAPAPAPSTSSAPANNNNNNNNNSNNNAGNTNGNQNRPASSSAAPSNTNNNNNNNNNSNSNTGGSNRGSEANQSNGSNRASSNTNAQPQAAAASAGAAPTTVNSAIAAASASASAAAASLLSAASASQASAEAAASAAAATLNRGVASSAAGASATGVNRANSSGSNNGSDGTTKVVVPIIIIAAAVAIIAVAWTVIRRIKKRKAEQYDPRLQPIERSYHHRSMMGPSLAAGGAAVAVGGAAAGLVRDRPRRDSYESFHAGRPISSLTEEEGEFSGNPPPMQEYAPYAAVGSAYGPAPSRLRNYGSTRGGNPNGAEDFPPAHRVTDSMYVDDYAGPVPVGGAVTPFSDEHGAYDVNYYDGSSTAGYNNKATRGMDAAGVSNGAGRSYSPYADVQRGEAGDEYYDYDRASSYRRDPFADSKRWSG